jgi:hypothetical protein
MNEKSKTLIYFVGGFTENSREQPFLKLYHCLHNKWAQQGTDTRQFKACLHLYRQSTWFPVPPRRSYEPSIPLLTDQTAEDLADQIDRDIERERRTTKATEIVIVAYSSGSALVRRALLQAKEREWEGKKLLAIKEYDSALIKPSDEKLINSGSWSTLVTSIIHIGGMTIGWEFNSQMPKLYLWLGPILRPIVPYWFPWQIYRGSKFISDTRIGLNLHHLPQTHNTFYLLGTQDQFLSPGDAVEPGGRPGHDPTYLEVAGFDHTSILNYETSRLDKILQIIIEVKKDEHCKKDKECETIIRSIEEKNLAQWIQQQDIDDYLNPMDSEPARRNEQVKHVVIVLHGIRDSGFWAKRIAQRIKKKHREKNKIESNNLSSAKKTDTVRVVSLSYGYFSLWDFLRPGGRRQAVEWFQNVYADITALYPRAEISFIGHSNGTYLGAHALQCENVKFRYLVLAGSVVRRDFWDTKGKEWQWRRKVNRVLNLQGVDDWIVGLLPGGLETIPILGNLMDLGSLGAYGNQWLREAEQIRLVGDHEAGIVDESRDNHAEFVLGEQIRLVGDHEAGIVDESRDNLAEFVLGEQIRLVGDHGAGIVDEGWDNLAEFVLQEDALTAKFYLSGNNKVKVFELAEKPSQLRRNRFLRFIRPIGGFYIYIALALCFSPLLQILSTWLCKLTNNQSILCPRFSPQDLWQHLIEAPTALTGLLAGLQQTALVGRQALFSMPSLPSASPENLLSIWLLLPLGILGALALTWNVLNSIINLSKLMEERIKYNEHPEIFSANQKGVDGGRKEKDVQSEIRRLQKLVIDGRKKILWGLVLIAPALLIAKVVVIMLHEYQTVMALLLILSILSFSLLKRI